MGDATIEQGIVNVIVARRIRHALRPDVTLRPLYRHSLPVVMFGLVADFGRIKIKLVEST